MEVENKITHVKKLSLSHDEIVWLKGIMQNPIWADSPSSEPEHDRNMRNSFWTALNDNTVD